MHKKGKVFPYSLLSVGPGADPGVQAVSPQVAWSESRHRSGSRLPLLSARPAVTSVALTCKRQHTSDSSLLLIYRPRKDERLSWPGWLTCSRWFTHTLFSGHPSAAGRSQDMESSPVRDRRSTTVPCHHLNIGKHRYLKSTPAPRVFTSHGSMIRWILADFSLVLFFCNFLNTPSLMAYLCWIYFCEDSLIHSLMEMCVCVAAVDKRYSGQDKGTVWLLSSWQVRLMFTEEIYFVSFAVNF